MRKNILFTLTLLSLLVLLPIRVNAKTTACQVIDGAYYDKFGVETDKGTYEKQCVSHTCELVADAYFGASGNEVTKETFEKECGATVYNNFPDTASNMTPLFIIIGSIIITEAFIIIDKKKQANN
ncbi:MAG: hypothetical protein IJG68_07585 [Bacilli bacterium]|nr:hypothetical protein [Bacilli bacterium]